MPGRKAERGGVEGTTVQRNTASTNITEDDNEHDKTVHKSFSKDQ